VTSPDELHRTIKLELDEGRATTVAEAERLASTYKLNVIVGSDVATSATRQAILLTALNCAPRAFRGGVAVSGDLDWTVTAGPFAGAPISEVALRLGTSLAPPFDGDTAAVVVGDAHHADAERCIAPTWNGWAAAVTVSGHRLSESAENPVSGVLAGALAVSETFQAARGAVVASRRDIGLSLWDINTDWSSVDAVGPDLQYLPTQLWLPGLGHLGQAYAWTISFLPYADPHEVHLLLQDFDTVVEANRSTGLLVLPDTPEGVRKTRLVAAAMERRGLRTTIVERRFDDTTKLLVDEPRWALAGFDSPTPRRHLDVFDLAIDLGLGAGHDDYLAMHLHSFPAAGNSSVVFDIETPRDAALPPAWAKQAASDPCGVLQLAGVAVGASFVGAAASAVGVAELLRVLVRGPANAVASWDLRAPQFFDAVPGDTAMVRNPGYQRIGASRT